MCLQAAAVNFPTRCVRTGIIFFCGNLKIQVNTRGLCETWNVNRPNYSLFCSVKICSATSTPPKLDVFLRPLKRSYFIHTASLTIAPYFHIIFLRCTRLNWGLLLPISTWITGVDAMTGSIRRAVWLHDKVRERVLGLRPRLNATSVCDAQLRRGGIRGLRRCISEPYLYLSLYFNPL